ncbi:MAG: PucR family transcriptional regulator [Oscillospiraceae bacterium]|nr:PucR family transcriptional regulator [Oscillospiraceae bacterium]
MRYLDFEKIQTILLDCIFDNSPISQMLCSVYAETHLPTIAFDVSFKLIAYCFERPFFIPGWEYLATFGTFTETDVLSKNFLHLSEQVMEGRTSQIVYTAGRADLKTAFGPIFQENTLIGYVATLTQDVDMDEAVALNELVCKSVSNIWELSQFTEIEIACRDILLGGVLSDSVSRQFYRRYRPPYAMAVIRTDFLGFAKTNYIKSLLGQRDDCYAVIGPLGNLRVLFGDVRTQTQLEDVKQLLYDIAEKYDCAAFLSDQFVSADDAGAAIIQLQLLFESHAALHRKDRVMDFVTHYIDAMCFALTQNNSFDRKYYLRSIGKLQTMYPRKCAELIGTLDAYFANMFNVSTAAAALGIHKNSVNYRLKNVCKALDLDINDHTQIDALFLELQLYHTLQALEDNEHGSEIN